MSSRSSKVSLRKERHDFQADQQNGYPFGAQGKLAVQVQYSLALNAPTGKFQLWVRTDSQAPYVLARKLDNSPYEFLTVLGRDNEGQDIFEFDGCYAQWKVVYVRDAWTDLDPNNPSVATNWTQIFWETK